MRKKLRTIVVDGRTYRWHRIHEHEPQGPAAPPLDSANRRFAVAGPEAIVVIEIVED